MQYAIITSKLDPAGVNIREQLISLFDFKEISKFDSNPVYEYKNIKLYLLECKPVHAEEIDKKIGADIFIFATKHVSKEGVHSFSCHTPGNWGSADYGGKQNKLCISPALLLKKAYLELKTHQKSLPTHQITLEVTHHGPLIDKPAMFIEIGSTEEYWKDKQAGEIIAKTIIKIIETPDPEGQRIAFCIGGPHYANNFNKILERTDIATAHICPKHGLEHLDESLMKHAIERTKEKVGLILLDWKGMGKEKARIKDIVEKLNLEIKRTDQVLK